MTEELLLVLTIVATAVSANLAWLTTWMIAGALGPLGLKTEVVDPSGKKKSPRLLVSMLGVVAFTGLWLWAWRATDLAVLGALLGTGAVSATLFAIVWPIWSAKNALLGPRRVGGAVGLIASILLWGPLLRAAWQLQNFWPTFISALRGEASLLHVLMHLWQSALGLWL